MTINTIEDSRENHTCDKRSSFVGSTPNLGTIPVKLFACLIFLTPIICVIGPFCLSVGSSSFFFPCTSSILTVGESSSCCLSVI